MKENFRGWRTVFSFTFHNSTTKAYKVVTILVTLAIIGALVIFNLNDARPEEEKEQSAITSVTILDESGVGEGDYHALMQEEFDIQYENTKFILAENETPEGLIPKIIQDSTTGILVHITKDETSILIEGSIPSNSTVSESDCENLLEDFKLVYQKNRLIQSGATLEQQVILLLPVHSTYHEVGESNGMIDAIIKIIAPMVFGLIMYMMLLLNGQTVSKSVSSEKTSKLMETLLTSIHPYALITGKILAVAATAMLQFLIWVIAAVVGLFGGNAIAHMMNPRYTNTVVQIIDVLRDSIGESALTIPAVILAVLLFCIGFLFYCILAGLAGCMVSKPEDVASTQGLFVFPILISWLVCYFGSAAGNRAVIQTARFIPFTIPFGLPVDLLTGVASIAQGVLSFVILLAFSLLLIMFSAKLYKGLVLYHGEKISLKKILRMLKSNE